MPVSDELAALISAEVGDRAAGWDLAGAIPLEVLRGLGAKGALCAEVPAEYGGRGLTGRSNGELTAHAGALCSSLRSVMTSQGMAAWTIQRFGTRAQRAAELARLTGGGLAAVAFSEPQAGSDLSAISTTIVDDGEDSEGSEGVVLNGHKVWSTAAAYADVLVVFGRYQDDAAAVVVPVDTPGVTVRPIDQPLGCRAAGHADVLLKDVRLPTARVLSGASQSLGLLTTIALTYGRLSVAWGCVGIIRSCLKAAASHARTREQFGKPLARHQLIARHLAELVVAEQTATRVCEHASECWDSRSAELSGASVLAKHVAAGNAARAASTAVQVLASAGSVDGEPVARAYRDAKLMQIIEGSEEICQLILAERALEGVA
ncbi:acyl-CoA dehydrogenase family protein [Streptomyces sp. NPDC018059]|uniref:acyl-CoA dehydrogenase family protein n=1 Tax=Streptomyces sp. NPDC018059 TaxID=3365041 RepID=UPI0037AAB9DF